MGRALGETHRSVRGAMGFATLYPSYFTGSIDGFTALGGFAPIRAVS